jgi:hypothetical protein
MAFRISFNNILVFYTEIFQTVSFLQVSSPVSLPLFNLIIVRIYEALRVE